MLLIKKLQQAYKKFNKKFSYDMLQATRVIDKIEVTCPIHGSFKQELRVHLRANYGCPKCARIEANKHMRKTQEAFIKEATKIHNNKYDYSLVAYKGDSSKVTIICPIHGEFTQQAGSHIGKSSCGCKKCSNALLAKNQMLSKHEIKQRANLPEHITADFSTYKGEKYKVTCKCKYHGVFETLPETLYKKEVVACPKCANLLRGWNRRLYKNKPTTIYLLKLTNGMYKLGITRKCDLDKRYSKKDRKYIKEVIWQLTILEGSIAWDIEKLVLRQMHKYKYKGAKVFSNTGITEILTKNPIDILQKDINELVF